ncbi:MAG: hypothetical protein MJZ12_00855 [Prevotella sp.]|nr:hypothetical protein [Prevotella sp.]
MLDTVGSCHVVDVQCKTAGHETEDYHQEETAVFSRELLDSPGDLVDACSLGESSSGFNVLLISLPVLGIFSVGHLFAQYHFLEV